jgi:hypothetical protein
MPFGGGDQGAEGDVPDNSGTITVDELRRGLASKGTKLSEDEVQQLMEAVRFFNHSSTNPAASHTHP